MAEFSPMKVSIRSRESDSRMIESLMRQPAGVMT